jgi:hypothetical protein
VVAFPEKIKNEIPEGNTIYAGFAFASLSCSLPSTANPCRYQASLPDVDVRCSHLRSLIARPVCTGQRLQNQTIGATLPTALFLSTYFSVSDD